VAPSEKNIYHPKSKAHMHNSQPLRLSRTQERTAWWPHRVTARATRGSAGLGDAAASAGRRMPVRPCAASSSPASALGFPLQAAAEHSASTSTLLQCCCAASADGARCHTTRHRGSSFCSRRLGPPLLARQLHTQIYGP
jgi:hypothetical protein